MQTRLQFHPRPAAQSATAQSLSIPGCRVTLHNDVGVVVGWGVGGGR